MYIKLLLLPALVLGSVVYGQGSKGFVINGKITGKDTGTVYLLQAGEKKAMDSVVLQNGQFTFNGKLPSPALYNIRLSGIEPVVAVFAENTTMELTADVAELRKATVTGSVSDSIYREFWALFSKKNKEGAPTNTRLNQKYNQTKPNSPERAALTDSFKLFLGEFRLWVEGFVKEHTASPVAAYVIYDRFIGFGSYEEAGTMFSWLKPAAANSYYGKKVAEALELVAKTDIGKTIRFTQADTSGKMVKLATIRAKYVLVDFWASWCGPCRKENPNVVEAYKKYHDKGFDIVGVSLDDKKEPWLNAIHKDALTWTHVSDLKGWQNEVGLTYGIKSVPASFLVDQQGKIVAKNLRGEELHKKLEELLAR
jgi:thiol-disulfide isomerase/thioredoxin